MRYEEDLGRFIAPEGLQDFSPGFQPWEPPTRATRPERAPDQTHKNSEEHIYIEPAIAQRGAGTLSISQREIASLPNEYPFLFGSIRSAFGRGDLSPFRANRSY